jgi:hypothetical protein
MRFEGLDRSHNLNLASVNLVVDLLILGPTFINAGSQFGSHFGPEVGERGWITANAT